MPLSSPSRRERAARERSGPERPGTTFRSAMMDLVPLLRRLKINQSADGLPHLGRVDRLVDVSRWLTAVEPARVPGIRPQPGPLGYGRRRNQRDWPSRRISPEFLKELKCSRPTLSFYRPLTERRPFQHEAMYNRLAPVSILFGNSLAGRAHTSAPMKSGLRACAACQPSRELERVDGSGSHEEGGCLSFEA